MVDSLSPKNDPTTPDHGAEKDELSEGLPSASPLVAENDEAATSAPNEEVAERVAAALEKAVQESAGAAEPSADAAGSVPSSPGLGDRIAALSSSDGLVSEETEESEPASRDHRGTILAKLFEADTAVANRTRWSVGTSRKTCVACSERLPEDQSFHTALCAPSDLGDAQIADASEVFERRDYCETCFASSPPVHAFASWLTVRPPAAEAPKKIVNLASLRVYFDQLGAIVKRAREEAGARAQGVELSESEIADVDRLRYLIALFLVRKRALRWVEHEPAALRLECKATDSIIEVPVPPTGAEMDEVTQAFDQLFG